METTTLQDTIHRSPSSFDTGLVTGIFVGIIVITFIAFVYNMYRDGQEDSRS